MLQDRFKGKPPKKDDGPRINDEIKAKFVRLISADGGQVGEVPIDEAIRLANEADLDLVEVAPEAHPPVCRIMDFGKYKYWQKKKLQESRKKSHVSDIKELRLRPKIDDHDLDVKIKKAREFIEDGNKVIVNVFFKGREMAHKEFGFQLLTRIEQALADIAKTESPPQEEGRRIGYTLVRKH